MTDLDLYDIENRVTALTFTSDSVDCACDALGRISHRTLNAGTTPVETVCTYLPGAYGTSSATGLVQTITRSGTTLTCIYDSRGSISKALTKGLTTCYRYDALGCLRIHFKFNRYTVHIENVRRTSSSMLW